MPYFVPGLMFETENPVMKVSMLKEYTISGKSRKNTLKSKYNAVIMSIGIMRYLTFISVHKEKFLEEMSLKLKVEGEK